MSDTPRTDKLSTFLVTQFPATHGNLELHQHLCELERCERELNEAVADRDQLRIDIAEIRRQHQAEASEWKTDEEVTADRDQWKAMAQEYHEAVNDSEKAIESAEARFNELNKS